MVGKKIIVSKPKGGLGFRDLEAFNGAMLQNPNSLCARVLKVSVTPTMRLYLPRVRAQLRGIAA